MEILKKKTILLVEDEVITAMMESKQLEDHGYSVIHAFDGEEAIQAVRNLKTDIDLILMDIDLHAGMDGTDAAEIILKEQEIPIVFLSSHTEPEIVERTERITSYGYVVKNSSPTVLFASIKMAFKLFDAKQKILAHQQRQQDFISRLEVTQNELLLKNELIEQNKEKYRQIVEFSPYLVAIHNNDVLYINKAGAEMVGYSDPADIIGKSLKKFLSPDEQVKAEERIKSAYQKGGETQIYHQKFLKSDGDEIDVEIAGILIQYENKPAIQIIAHDISDRIQLEKKNRLDEAASSILFKLHQKMNLPQEDLFDYILEASLNLTESLFSFFGLLNEDETVMTIHAWSKNTMELCSVSEPLFNFDIERGGMWGECVRQRKEIIINNYEDVCHGGNAYPAGHVPISRFMCVPVLDGDRIVAIGGVANKTDPYERSDAQALLLIYDRMWGIIRCKQTEEVLLQSEEDFKNLFEDYTAVKLIFDFSS